MIRCNDQREQDKTTPPALVEDILMVSTASTKRELWFAANLYLGRE